jgi:integrase/recombinase XerD
MNKKTAIKNEFLEDYLYYLQVEKGLARNSCSNYSRDLHKLLFFLQARSKDLLTCSTADMHSFLREEKEKGRSARTLARYCASFRGLFRFLVREDKIKEDPAIDLAVPKAEQKLPHIYSEKS